MVAFFKTTRGKHDCLPVPVGWNDPVYRGHYSLITPKYMYASLKGRLSVCFVEDRSLNKGVCFRKWEFENGSMFWKMEVCFRKSELKIRICCRKSEFDVGTCSARVAWALVPDCAEGSMFRHWRNGGQCWSNDDKKTTFLNLTQNQVKDLQETLCKRRKKRRKTERGTTCPTLTKNTKSQDHKRN